MEEKRIKILIVCSKSCITKSEKFSESNSVFGIFFISSSLKFLVRVSFVLLSFVRLVTMSSFFDNPLGKIGVDTSATFVLGGVVNAAPVDLVVPSLLPHEDISVVL